jgi:hypothetical protein
VTLQRIVSVLCLGFVALIIAVHQDCAPKYFQRGDVLALLGIAALDAVALLWATAFDSDGHRAAGAVACASAIGLAASTFSVPVLLIPLVLLAGLRRLPRSRTLRTVLLLAMPLALVLTGALPYLGQMLVSADQFHCP